MFCMEKRTRPAENADQNLSRFRRINGRTKHNRKAGEGGRPVPANARKRGRPTDYHPDLLEHVRLMARGGATQFEIARACGVTQATFTRWLVENPEFKATLRLAKAGFDDRIEHSLAQKAMGYSYESEVIKVVDGRIARVPVIEHVPPSDSAAIFWLKNRRPNEWRDKRDIELGGELDVNAVNDSRKTAMAVLEMLQREANRGVMIDVTPNDMGDEPDDMAGCSVDRAADGRHSSGQDDEQYGAARDRRRRRW